MKSLIVRLDSRLVLFFGFACLCGLHESWVTAQVYAVYPLSQADQIESTQIFQTQFFLNTVCWSCNTSFAIFVLLLSGLQGSCVTAQVYTSVLFHRQISLQCSGWLFWENYRISGGSFLFSFCNLRFISFWSAGILCNGASVYLVSSFAGRPDWSLMHDYFRKTIAFLQVFFGSFCGLLSIFPFVNLVCFSLIKIAKVYAHQSSSVQK